MGKENFKAVGRRSVRGNLLVLATTLALAGGLITLASMKSPQAAGTPPAQGTPTTRTFTYDFPEFRVGTAEYEEGPTGTTVFYFPGGTALAAVDIRGGAAAVRESSSIDILNSYGMIDALVLAGGSTYGLDAASGVIEKLFEDRGRSTKFIDIPAVPGAVVYDFSGRENSLYPDRTLGARAFTSSVTNRVRVGAAGAGANVSVGKFFGREYAERSGQGAAFVQRGPVKIFVLSVVNAVGNVLDRQGRIVAGSRDPKTGQRFHVADRLLSMAPPTPTQGTAPRDNLGNTTITAVITNLKLSRADLQRLAVMSHTAMGRAIDPFHTPYDGDTLFTVSTGSVALSKDSDFGVAELGVLTARLLQDAVVSAVSPATP